MAFVMDLFRRKKENPNQATVPPVTVLNETYDQDGFIVYSGADASQSTTPGVLPYNLQTHQAADKKLQSLLSVTKPTDGIPFQFSATYEKKWSPQSTSIQSTRKLKQIDWDALCYDFKLEKSILQS